jgi:hypothetical protein
MQAILETNAFSSILDLNPKNLVKELKKANKTIAKMSAPSQASLSATSSSAHQTWFVRSCEGSTCQAVQATAFELDSGSSDHIVRDASGIYNIDLTKTQI